MLLKSSHHGHPHMMTHQFREENSNSAHHSGPLTTTGGITIAVVLFFTYIDVKIKNHFDNRK